MTKEKDDKVLSLTDASAGFLGAAFLYFIQKLPEGSDAKQILLYSMTVFALAANNIFGILFSWVHRKWERRSLKTQHKDLVAEVAEYSKNDNPDPEVMQEFNSAMKKTQMALLRNLTATTEGLPSETDAMKKTTARKKMNN